jgi:hypothetical protein
MFQFHPHWARAQRRVRWQTNSRRIPTCPTANWEYAGRISHNFSSQALPPAVVVGIVYRRLAKIPGRALYFTVGSCATLHTSRLWACSPITKFWSDQSSARVYSRQTEILLSIDEYQMQLVFWSPRSPIASPVSPSAHATFAFCIVYPRSHSVSAQL